MLKHLEKGTRLNVVIVEVQTGGSLLVAYRGNLFRVKNTSGRRFQPNEEIMLVVSQKNPLEFSLVGEQRLFSRMV